jgi:hypothetical protein
MAKQRLDIEISGNDSKFGAAADRTMARLNKIGGAARSAMGMLGIGIGVSALKSVVDYGSKVSDLAQSLGISAENLQRMEYAASQLGLSLEEITKALTNMQRYAGEALGGNQRYMDIFGRMGVSMEELKSLSPDALFFKIAKNVKEAGYSSQMMADGMTIMGRNGAMVLGAMRDGFADVARQADAAGVVIEEKVIGTLDRLADTSAGAMKRLKAYAAVAIGMPVAAWERVWQVAGAMSAGMSLTQAIDLAAGMNVKGAARKSSGGAMDSADAVAAGATPSASSVSTTADALAKIGLFSGGSSSIYINIARQQLTELKKMSNATERVASSLSEDAPTGGHQLLGGGLVG